MRKVAILLSLLLLIFPFPTEGKKKTTKTKKRQEDVSHISAQWSQSIYIIGNGEIMEFSTKDKALFYGESLRASCGCEVIMISGGEDVIKDCLRTAIKSIKYPERFNVELFRKDVEERLGQGKEVEGCRYIRGLEEVVVLLRKAGMQDIAMEVEKFLNRREKGQ